MTVNVIVVFGDRVVMENSLREALVKLFGDAPMTLEQQGGATTPPPPSPDGGTTQPPPATGTTWMREAPPQRTGTSLAS